MINCDAKLKKVLLKDSVSMFDIAKVFAEHVVDDE